MTQIVAYRNSILYVYGTGTDSLANRYYDQNQGDSRYSRDTVLSQADLTEIMTSRARARAWTISVGKLQVASARAPVECDTTVHGRTAQGNPRIRGVSCAAYQSMDV